MSLRHPLDGLPVAPQRGAVGATVHLQPDRRAVPLARRFVLDHAEGLAEGDRDALALLTSELVTNAVLHARTELVVAVALAASGVLVGVADAHPLTPERRSSDPDSTDGRGLTLVDDLADEWGWHPHEDGKTVWFTLRPAGTAMRWRGARREVS